jgi:signal transduction histidine kinase
VYFSVLEALQNVAKYADAASATVVLGGRNGEVRFEVTDDGRGFDPAVGARHRAAGHRRPRVRAGRRGGDHVAPGARHHGGWSRDDGMSGAAR